MMTRSASTPCARIIAPAAPPIWLTTRPTATAGKTIGCPVLALWGSSGLPANAGLDTLACWRDWAPDLRGFAIDSGHYLPEENPAATAQALLEFFGDGIELTASHGRTYPTARLSFSGTREVAERLRFDAGAA